MGGSLLQNLMESQRGSLLEKGVNRAFMVHMEERSGACMNSLPCL